MIIGLHSEEEGAVQEPARTYFEKLSYLFGADSTCVGMTDDMNFPEWYSGCFVNGRNRLNERSIIARISKFFANFAIRNRKYGKKCYA